MNEKYFSVNEHKRSLGLAILTLTVLKVFDFDSSDYGLGKEETGIKNIFLFN